MSREEFINQVIKGWMKTDLEKMIEVESDKTTGYGGLNYPLAQITISNIETLGSFLNGEDLGFNCNIKKYINNCMSSHKEILLPEILGDYVRHSISHNYLSRIPISNDNSEFIIYLDQNDNICFNSRKLATEFIKSLEIFQEKLTKEDFKNRTEQFKNTITEFNVKYSDKIKKLTNISKKNNLYSFNSLASGTHHQ